jgi:HTH-type transcriptional regulator / antitoxin HigA
MKVELALIRTDAEHRAALKQVERLWGAKTGTADGNRLEVLALLIDQYEATRWPIDNPDPVDAILFRMEQQGLTRADLEPLIGSRARVAEILGRVRPLSIRMIRNLREKLDIPADILIAPSKRRTSVKERRSAA